MPNQQTPPLPPPPLPPPPPPPLLLWRCLITTTGRAHRVVWTEGGKLWIRMTKGGDQGRGLHRHTVARKNGKGPPPLPVPMPTLIGKL
jgi:hypothetical protein